MSTVRRLNTSAVRNQPKPAKKPAAIPDQVFFTKEQVKIGTRFVYLGRLDPMSIWRVTSITTYQLRPSGRLGPVRVDAIVHLNDTIGLVREGSNEGARLSFSYMSYSAIWQLRG